MNRILEIDTENHVAVVEPGVTLDQLDEVTAAHDLIYPVFPGEYSASLGGNVATNAGGMRAVKYGVTRHQVLGLEAVLATGEIIRTGGKFVKATTGYDLTQLIIGSEGTLALVTEATLKLYPRLRAPGDGPRAVHDARPGHRGDPADRRQRHRPAHPRVHRHDDALDRDRVRRPRPRHPPGRPGHRARVPRRDDGEPARGPARRGRRARSPSSSPSSARSTCTCCRRPRPAQLIDAREKAFWVAKANNADDIFDVVVPRASIPEFMAKVSELAANNQSWIAGCGHAGDGNVHLSIFQPDPEIRYQVTRELFEIGMALGGAISGEHGIGEAKKRYFLELEDPVKVDLMRRIKTAFDPAGILNPGTIFDSGDQP